MQNSRKVSVAVTVLTLLGGVLMTSNPTEAQDGVRLPKSIHIQAQAMGQGTQLGRSIGVTIIVQEFSTTEDQKALLAAFLERGNDGLVNALTKMKSKGRMSITGTLGYDVTYIKRFQLPDGRIKIRLVTDRPINFGEKWADTRSTDYNLSAAEIILSPDNKKNSGTLLPACKFKINKKNALEIELLQNEWKLVNVRRR